MEGSKEQFTEMREQAAQREWICIMSDEVYCSLPYELRESFKYTKATFPSLHEQLYNEDPTYKNFYLRKKTASKNLDEYIYQIRDKK